VLRLHQIRYGVDLTGYDLLWTGVGVLILLAGAVLVLRGRARPST
jgi:uncharacterized membrane protein